jgi:hypothetical protein
VGASEVPKVFLQRSFALVLAALVVVEWARNGGRIPTRQGWLAIRSWPIVASAALVLLATVVSALASPMPWVSLLGPDVGRDSYGVASLLSYLAVFSAHLLGCEQASRCADCCGRSRSPPCSSVGTASVSILVSTS